MTGTPDAIALAEAVERLRQQQEIFEQQMRHDRWGTYLRLAAGWVAIPLLAGICVLSGYVILNSSNYSTATVGIATSALLVESLGVIGGTWKFLATAPTKELAPTIGEPSGLPVGDGS